VTVTASFLAVLVLGFVAFLALRPDPQSAGLPTATSTDPGTPALSASPTQSPTPAPTPTTTTPKPAVTTRRPVPTGPPPAPPPPAERPPDPDPTTPAPSCTPSYVGENAPQADVRDALVAAGAKQYWVGVQRPSNLVGDLPVITVPPELMKAVAWQESGWQSAIMACDGGMGTMQVMSGTVAHMNQRFGNSYTIPLSLKENTEVGANYLEWLIMYYGAGWFNSNFALDLRAPLGPNGEKYTLMELVISAYNVGPGGLQISGSTALRIPNRQYVDNVLALIDDCTCQSL
jgi:hypothetical protein